MAQFINFFPRQIYMGSSNVSGTYYSEVFEVSNAVQMYWEGRIWAASSTGTTGIVTLQDSDVPSMTGFSDYDTLNIVVTSGATLPIIYSGSSSTIPKRFMRAKLTIPTATYMALKFTARALV